MFSSGTRRIFRCERGARRVIGLYSGRMHLRSLHLPSLFESVTEILSHGVQKDEFVTLRCSDWLPLFKLAPRTLKMARRTLELAPGHSCLRSPR